MGGPPVKSHVQEAQVESHADKYLLVVLRTYAAVVDSIVKFAENALDDGMRGTGAPAPGGSIVEGQGWRGSTHYLSTIQK